MSAQSILINAINSKMSSYIEQFTDEVCSKYDLEVDDVMEMWNSVLPENKTKPGKKSKAKTAPIDPSELKACKYVYPSGQFKDIECGKRCVGDYCASHSPEKLEKAKARRKEKKAKKSSSSSEAEEDEKPKNDKKAKKSSEDEKSSKDDKKKVAKKAADSSDSEDEKPLKTKKSSDKLSIEQVSQSTSDYFLVHYTVDGSSDPEYKYQAVLTKKQTLHFMNDEEYTTEGKNDIVNLMFASAEEFQGDKKQMKEINRNPLYDIIKVIESSNKEESESSDCSD